LRPSGDPWKDVEAFEQAAATADRPREPADHRAALDLYKGELLTEDPTLEEHAELIRLYALSGRERDPEPR
jgi:hypothetical protein